MNPFLRQLELIRRRIPYAYWLCFDAVLLWALIWGGVGRFFALPMLAIAIFFDVVEFIVKATEPRWGKRFFEGTGPPT